MPVLANSNVYSYNFWYIPFIKFTGFANRKEIGQSYHLPSAIWFWSHTILPTFDVDLVSWHESLAGHLQLYSSESLSTTTLTSTRSLQSCSGSHVAFFLTHVNCSSSKSVICLDWFVFYEHGIAPGSVIICISSAMSVPMFVLLSRCLHVAVSCTCFWDYLHSLSYKGHMLLDQLCL